MSITFVNGVCSFWCEKVLRETKHSQVQMISQETVQQDDGGGKRKQKKKKEKKIGLSAQ